MYEVSHFDLADWSCGAVVWFKDTINPNVYATVKILLVVWCGHLTSDTLWVPSRSIATAAVGK